MKYSLRSLMIVVTLACAASALAGRSRYCLGRAAFHKSKLPSGMQCRRSAEAHGIPVETLSTEWLIFHGQSHAAYERVGKRPWLPLLLPSPPVPEDPQEVVRRERELAVVRTKLAEESREKYGVP